MMRHVVSMPFAPGPYLCKFHPVHPSVLVAASQAGQFQFIDLQDEVSEPKIYQVRFCCVRLLTLQIETEGLLDFDISSSGDLLAFGDINGYISLWTEHSPLEHMNLKINEFSNPTEIVDPMPPPPRIRMNQQR
jgi:hypothetical protein